MSSLPIYDINNNVNNATRNIAKFTTEGGIFFVFALDSIIFLIGVLLFLLCWRRTALYQKSEASSTTTTINDIENRYAMQSDDDEYEYEYDNNRRRRPLSIILTTSRNGTHTQTYLDRFIQWLFHVREYEQFASKYGHEVAVYLYFSKQMFLALSICTVLGLSILLPIHLTGTPPETKLEQQQYGNWKFSQNDYFLLTTTVSMVNQEPNKLYAHLILSIVFVIIVLTFLHRFNSSRFTQTYVNAPNRTKMLKGASKHIMISNYSAQLSNLPPTLVDNKVLRQALEEVYPDQVFSTRIVLDMRKRIELQNKYDHSTRMIEHYVALQEQKANKRPTVVLCCGEAATDGCCGMGTNAIAFWEAKRDHYQQKIAQWENSFRNKPKATGFAHVIFKTTEAAAACRAAGEGGNALFRTRNIDFRADRAPEPEDLKWKNFSFGFSQRSARTIGVHIVLVIFLLFFTSPLSIVSTIQDFGAQVPYFAKAMAKIHQLTGYVGDLLFQYLPTLLLFIFTLLIPTVIPILTKMELYRSHSNELRVKLLRLFIYLILSTLILPSLLLTSLDGVINYLQKENVSGALQNLFLPSSGAFFLNYAIQYCLLGAFIDLLRLKDFFTYLYKRWTAVTPTEKEEALKVGDFDIAMEYAYQISFFAIILAYSVFSPFMLLVGMLFYLSKYLIDRHNITRLCNKNDKAQYKLTRDLHAYRQKTRLITHLMMANVLVFEIMMLLFFAKGGRDLYVHLIITFIFLAATVIYCIHWTVNFDNKQSDVETPLMSAEDVSEAHDMNLLLHYCTAFGDVYFSPYSLDLLPQLKQQMEEELKHLHHQVLGDDGETMVQRQDDFDIALQALETRQKEDDPDDHEGHSGSVQEENMLRLD